MPGWRKKTGLFDFGGVVEAITTKLVRRHPHVFGDARDLNSQAVKALWGRIKAEEKHERAEARKRAGVDAEPKHGALGGVPKSMPALTRALKLQEKAAKVGFDWEDVRGVVAKLREEIAEAEAEIAAGAQDKLAVEIGDLMFAAVNLARYVDVDPEAALRGANAKFERRFSHIERRLAEERTTARSRGSRRDGSALAGGETPRAREPLSARL